ncbi:unnamed protein product [Mytilus coruscus]|uniref:Integrase catalytic domain-containing protein n=1 Tax=Mytilus coruscus TaxID=42192 RepID=A0A6J8D9Q9_MYTCO|nr:unnamed protein product [Mytilus coruscus]
MYQHIYPDASKMVIRNSYVDDILQSVESVDNARLITQQTEKMFACGGFRIKHWIISGNEKCGSTLQSQDSGESVEVDLDEFAHEKILGMRWDPKQDLFDFKESIEQLKFHRCLKPDNAVGDPILVIFSDGSKLAYGTCAYVRWGTAHGGFESRLVIAKNRIAPTKQMSVPRLELCGAVLAARIRQKLVEEMDYKFSRVIHIVDSMIVRAQIQRESYGFGTFVATRVAEIQNKTEPSDWWWVQSDFNAADLATRITSPNDMVKNSIWKNGPKFLNDPIDQWPLRQDCNLGNDELPDTIGIVMSSDIKKMTNTVSGLDFEDVKLENISSYSKLLRVTCILMRIVTMKSFKGASIGITAESLNAAELEWIRYLQRDISDDWTKTFRRLSPEKNEAGIVVVGKRLADWLKATWNRTDLMLLPNKGHYVWLYLKSVHDQDHAGVDVTLAKVRSKFWIPKVHKSISMIRKRCVISRRRDNKCIGQQMGPLPLERLQPSPAFSYCSVDLFGPLTIKDTVKGRTHGKAYGVLFNCMSSRAVYVDLADGYGTSSFIMVLRRFTSVRGYPKKIRSDLGSQLVSASKELKEVIQNWHWDTIKMFGNGNGMEWEFTKAADAPWENGCSEALIKSVKKSLSLAIGQSIMTFSELQTVLFEVANILNERPIGTSTSDPNEGTYLCPNDLILGRASSI